MSLTTDRPIVSMPTNPGGVVDPHELVGREREQAELIEAVEIGGAKLLGDRRMGKTSLLASTAEALRDAGHHVVRVSAETSDPDEFGRRLLDAMQREDFFGRVLPRWRAELGGSLGINVGVAALTLTGSTAAEGGGPRSRDLFAACSEAADRAGHGRRVVFVLDEITALARAVARRGDEPEVLFQSLRAPRQLFTNVSVVIAGSIGLHHVLHDMAVVNDIPSLAVGPLTGPDAEYLARCLLRGAGLASNTEVEVAQAVARECSFVPFYVHKLVEALATRGMRDPQRGDITQLVDGILRHPDDLWEMRHYDTRLDDYYGDDARAARATLDAIAVSPEPVTVAGVAAALAAHDLDPRPSRDRVLDLLYRLEADHYLLRIGDRDTFATPLLRRAWLGLRRLRTLR